MNEQEDFFSPNHKRLLSIATWAKYLAWVILIVNVFYALGVYVQEQAQFSYFSDSYGQFGQFLKDTSSYAISLLVEMIAVFFKGIVYFLLLKSVSLGLNMIVETDINYRDNRKQGGVS